MSTRERAAFGELLRRFRLAAGLTQTALAEQAQLSEDAISALERGTRRTPHRDTIQLLSAGLRLGPEERAALFAAATRPRRATVAGEPAPVIAAPARTAGQPPPALTSFLGRERDLGAVGLLLEAGRRLVTLSGAGGVGKTRLALELMRAVAPRFPDGVWFVDLSPLSDPALVPRAVADALTLPDAPEHLHQQAIAAWLAPRTALLVVDNCEHLLEASAALVGALVRACPYLAVVATSRERLGIRGEQVYQLSPLSLPPPSMPSAGISAGAALLEFAAVRLFVERAQAARANFALSAENAAAVVTICRRLDGLPLAIELAAARVRVLSPAQIAARLEDRFQLLTTAPREAPARQQTLRALIEWSYELLSGAERAMLRRLAVFAGGWTLEATEAVCPDEELAAWEVLDLLSSLVDKSLIVAETRAEAARYALLESIREYAAERLAATGETRVLRRRHAEYFLALAEEALPKLRGAEQIVWLQRLEDEHNNLRAALSWASGADIQMALRLAVALGPFWEGRGHLEEGRRWVETLLASPASRDVPSSLRARATLAGGRLAQWQTRLEQAATLLEESLALARPLGEPCLAAEALVHLGAVRRRQGAFAESARLLEESLALYRAAEDSAGMAQALLTLGVTVRFQGDVARSIALLEESLAHFRALGDLRWLAITLTMLGGSLLQQRDYVRAAPMIREGLAGHWAVGDLGFLAFGLVGMAAVFLAEEQPEKAARMLGAMEALREALGAPLAPANREEYERLERAVRRVLGAGEFDAALAAGRALLPGDAIALALEDPARDGSTEPAR